MADTPTPTFSTRRVTEIIGATYREVDYWDRMGYVNATVPATGSGSRRRYSLREVLIMRAMLVVRDIVAPDGGKWDVAGVAKSVGALPADALLSPDGFEVELTPDATLMVRRDMAFTPEEQGRAFGKEPAR